MVLNTLLLLHEFFCPDFILGDGLITDDMFGFDDNFNGVELVTLEFLLMSS